MQPHSTIGIRELTFSGCLLVGLILAFLINPETIPAGGGFGFDGVVYARMVSEIDQMILNGDLSEYYAQRILPSLMVRFGLTAFGFPLDPQYIIGGFRVLNILLMFASLWLWMRIAQIMHLTRLAFWIGILGLVLIFPNAKQLFYYPVLTDTFAFTIGLAMVWAHLTGRTTFVAGLSIIGALGWQMAGIVGMALVASTLITAEKSNTERSQRLTRRFVITTAVASAILGAAIGLPYLLGLDLEQMVFQRTFASDPFLRLLTNIPALALAAGFGFALLSYAIFTSWKPNLDIKSVGTVAVLLVAIIAIPNTIVSLISNPELPPPGLSRYGEILQALLVLRVREGLVLLPLVSHAVYYGPVFLLLLVLWRQSIQTTVELGAGFACVMALFVGLSVFSESRFTFILWPFVVTVTCKVISVTGANRLTQLIVALGAIGFSKFWLTINQAPWPMPDYSALFEWPKSVYFSSHGPWMSVENYLIQGSIVAALFFLIVFAMTRGRTIHSVFTEKE